MNNLLRVKAIAGSAVTWLTAVGFVLPLVIDDIADVIGVDHPVVVFAGRIVVWIGLAVTIIRRVTPVLPEARGVLPQGGPVTEREDLLTTELIQALQ